MYLEADVAGIQIDRPGKLRRPVFPVQAQQQPAAAALTVGGHVIPQG